MSLLDTQSYWDTLFTSPSPTIATTSNPNTVTQPATTTDWSSLFKGLTGLTSAAAPIVGAALGKSPSAPKPNATAPGAPGGFPWLYLAIGGVAALVAVLVFRRR